MAGAVAVKEALELRLVASHQHQLALGDGGALGGDRGLQADGPAAEGVELALDHDEGLAFADVAAGAVQIEEEIALAEDGGLGRVDVFGLVGVVVLRREVGLACGEGGDAALMIADGDHESAAKARTQRTEREQGIVVKVKQAALADGGFGEFFLHQSGAEAAAGGVGEADLELVGEFHGEAAFLDPIAAHPLSMGARALEGLVKVIGGGLMEIE